MAGKTLMELLGKNLKSGVLEINVKGKPDKQGFIEQVRTELSGLGYLAMVSQDIDDKNLYHIQYRRSENA